MNMKHRLARIKKGFTLLELTVVIATTSILLLGFTAFTIFFSNQYAYEMDINENENSAITLKYAISNNIDKFNYTYEFSSNYKDFNYDETSKIVANNLIFSTVTPIEAEGQSSTLVDVYSGVIIRDFKFIEATADTKPYFGYVEKVYNFSPENYVYHEEINGNRPREIELRKEIAKQSLVPIEEEFKVYQTLSKMELEIKFVGDVVKDNQKCKEFSFTIDYDFEKDDAQAGTKQLTFNKYVYFIE